MTTQKINETLIREILKNNSEEEAIRQIAVAMTNRDEIIKNLRK